MTPAEPKLHEWMREEYYKMAQVGLFDGKHVELIEGQVIELSPIGSEHRTSVILAGDVLRQAFGPGYFISIQSPMNLGEKSEPEPDIAVIRGHPRDYSHAHPTTAELVVEVADTSLHYDTHDKASLYARAGIKVYWVVDVFGQRLEVFREAGPDATQVYGHGFALRQTLGPADSVDVAGGKRIRVSDLLP